MSLLERTRYLEGGDDLIVTRVVDAPRAVVFKAWTEPEHLKEWYAPDGCTTSYCTVDLRVGGKFHFCMRMADGLDIWGMSVYHEIIEPERIVFTDAFADAEGNVVPPTHYGMSADYPPETVVAVTFVEQNGRTTITLRHVLPSKFPERDGMLQGWSQMLDRLKRELQHVMKGTTR